MLRELREELGAVGEVMRVFRPFIAWNVREQDPPVSLLLFPFGVALMSRDLTPDPREVTGVAWVPQRSWPGTRCYRRSGRCTTSGWTSGWGSCVVL